MSKTTVPSHATKCFRHGPPSSTSNRILGAIGLLFVIIAAMAFGGVMENSGLLARLIQPLTTDSI